MNDAAIFTAVKGLLDTAWPIIYPDDVAPLVAQAWQPQAEGIATGPAIYFSKVFDHRHGSPKRDSTPDPDNIYKVIRRELQQYETTLQFMGIWEDGALTAADILNNAAAVLQSDLGLDTLRAAGLGVQRVTTVQNPKFVNGSDEYEASPSFDCVVTHTQVTLTKAPAVTAYDFRHYPV